MKCILSFLVAVAVSLAFACPASATYLIDGDSAASGWAISGAGWNSFATPSYSPTLGWSGIGAGYAYDVSGTGTATYTPGAVSGFVAGQYDVYCNWAVHPEHNSAINYTVNHVGGSQSFTVNQQLNAAQGNMGSLSSLSPAADSGGKWATGSGLKYLGTFNIDSASSIVLNRETSGTTTMVADGVVLRAANEGRLIDEQSASVTATTDMPYIYHVDGAPSGNYRLLYQGISTLTWNPEVSAAGVYDVKISWGANANHQSADYWVDFNGDGVKDAGDTSFAIDQGKLADQITAATADSVWSGWFDLGNLNLTPASRIIESNVAYGSNNMTAAPMLVTSVPEPSCVVLVLTGFIGLLAYAWRKQR